MTQLIKKLGQAQAFDSRVSYVLEQEAVNPGLTFVVKELNELYVENLKSFCIEWKTQTTRFTKRLLTAVPNRVARTVSNSTIVLFDEKVQELITDCVLIFINKKMSSPFPSALPYVGEESF